MTRRLDEPMAHLQPQARMSPPAFLQAVYNSAQFFTSDSSSASSDDSSSGSSGSTEIGTPSSTSYRLAQQPQACSTPNCSVNVPPLNFAIVSKGLYRSGFPRPENYGYLEGLGLKTLM